MTIHSYLHLCLRSNNNTSDSPMDGIKARQMLHQHGVSLSEQHTVDIIPCHSTWTMHVALAAGVVSLGG